jgi:hypothetical protein
MSCHVRKVPQSLRYIQVSKVNIALVVIDTIKKLWKELIRLLSAEVQPKKAVLAQAYMGVFFIRSVSGTNFVILFLPKPSAYRRGLPGEPSRTTGDARTTI